MAGSQVQTAKRLLVAALKSLARTYGVRVDLTNTSPDRAVRSAYRRVYLRAHPDKGGSGRREKSALPVLKIARFCAGRRLKRRRRGTPDAG